MASQTEALAKAIENNQKAGRDVIINGEKGDTESLRDVLQHKNDEKVARSKEQSVEDVEAKRLRNEGIRLSNEMKELKLARAEAQPKDIAEHDEKIADTQAKIDATKQAKYDATMQGKVLAATASASNKVVSTANRISTMKTVGGIGLLLVILAVLLFIVVQVNAEGDTRLKMLWAMILGRAQLQGRVDVAKQTQTTVGNPNVINGILNPAIQAAQNIENGATSVAGTIGSDITNGIATVDHLLGF